MNTITGFITLILLLICTAGYDQGIALYSVTNARQPGPNSGYTLDGEFMQSSRLKLLNPYNFGPTGQYRKTITIIDSFGLSGSLSGVTSLPLNALFFFGAFNLDDGSMHPFTGVELDSLYVWSKRGGKVIIAESSSVPSYTYNAAALNSIWGFDIAYSPSELIVPNAAGAQTLLFNGPFGVVTSAAQGGFAQGYISPLPVNSVVLGENTNTVPTAVLDCNTLDLIVGDVDAYTSVGALSVGSGVVNLQDKFWANTIAFMDQLEGPPIITQSGTLLSTGSYASYQWYLNGVAVDGQNLQQYSIEGNGAYSVEVTLQCGCKLMSDTITVDNYKNKFIVHSAFTPNGDGKNDVLYVKGKDLEEVNFSIYDRWGERVFESHNPNYGWDGNFNGRPMQPQVLLYYVEVKFTNGETDKGKGSLTLLR